MEVKDFEGENGDEQENGSSDDLVERKFDEARKQNPEKPLQFKKYKEGDENRSHKHTNGRGDKAERYYDDGNGLGSGKQDDDDHVDDSSKDIRNARRIHPNFEVRDPLLHSLEFCLIDFIGQELRLVGNEIMEASPDTRNRRAVVIHHSEAKADSQEETCEVVEVEE